MTRDFSLRQSPHLAEQLARSSGEPPAEPRLAATVMLLRDSGADHPEVFMMTRVAGMAFAASMTVFPGGGADPRDDDPGLPWAGPTAAEWATRLGCPEGEARMLVAAAVREVFEECGVLLAGPDADAVVDDLRDERWHQARQALEAREVSLSELLRREGLVLRTDLLAYRAHWVTPEFEPRRYDTRFFTALLPQGQAADDRTGEASHADWRDPAAVLTAAEHGELLLMPPTRVCLEELAEGDLDSLMRSPSDVPRVCPQPTRVGDETVLRTPLASREGEPA